MNIFQKFAIKKLKKQIKKTIKAKEKTYSLLRKINESSLDEKIKNNLNVALNKANVDYEYSLIARRGIDENFLAKERANLMFLSFLEKMPQERFHEITSVDIKIRDNKFFRGLIGTKGLNKDYFEEITGTKLFISKDQSTCSISTFNYLDKALAVSTINELWDRFNSNDTSRNKKVNQKNIRRVYELQKRGFDKNCTEIGRAFIKKNAPFLKYSDNVYRYIGYLSYRTSYKQNVLIHSLEVARFAHEIAKAMELDPIKAFEAAFFHDIGKGIELETGIAVDHVEEGMKIAKKNKLGGHIQRGIWTHHRIGLVELNLYDRIVHLADKWSAIKKGERIYSIENENRRIQELKGFLFDMMQQAKIYRFVVFGRGHGVSLFFTKKNMSEEFVKSVFYQLASLIIRSKYNNKIGVKLVAAHNPDYNLFVTEEKIEPKEEKDQNLYKI